MSDQPGAELMSRWHSWKERSNLWETEVYLLPDEGRRQHGREGHRDPQRAVVNGCGVNMSQPPAQKRIQGSVAQHTAGSQERDLCLNGVAP